MNRWIIFAGYFFLASAAHGANPNWVNRRGDVVGGLQSGDIARFQWTSTATASSAFLDTGGRAFSCILEPDTTGSDTTAQADLYRGTLATTDASVAKQWDTDGDAIPDDNTLDSTNVMKDGTPVFQGLLFIYIDPIANPPANHTAEVVCMPEAIK